MHAYQSWQASSISRFRTAAALSSSRRCAWWRTVRDTFFQPFCNAISRQSLGKCLVMVMVIAKLMYHLKIAVSLLHCFSFTSIPSASGYSVSIKPVRSIHTLQCHIAMYKCHASSTQQCTWTYRPRQRWFHMAELVHGAICWMSSSKFESMKIIRSFDHMVQSADHSCCCWNKSFCRALSFSSSST